MSKAREIVLRLVSEGKITVEEAEELLDAVEGGEEKASVGMFMPGPNPRQRANFERERVEQERVRNRDRAAAAQERAQGKRAKAQAKAQAKQARSSGHAGGFEFNFPWDQPDWEWPWEQEDWQWPWEQEDWQWGQASSPAAEMEVPENAQLKIKVDGGDLSVTGNPDSTSLRVVVPDANNKITAEDGVITVSSEGEDVMVEVPDRVASIEISGNGGDAVIGKLEADLVLQIAGGDMILSDFSGKLQASVEGGDASFNNIKSTSVEVRTNGGDTSLSMVSPVEEGSIILSGSDDIALMLPKDAKCDVSATAGDGEVGYNNLPEGTQLIEEEEHFLKVSIDGGGADVTLSSNSGDISVAATA